MTPRDLDRIRFVSQHFNDLQGLRLGLPFGLILLGYGGLHLSWVWPLMLLFFAAILTGLLMANRRGISYYRKRFGEVERLPALQEAELSPVSVYSPAGPAPLTPERRPMNPVTRWILIPAAVALTLFVILRAISPSTAFLTDNSLWYPWLQFNTPVLEVGGPHPSTWTVLGPSLAQALYAICGACFVGVWLWRGRRFSQSYYLVLGILLLGLAACGSCLGLLLPALWGLHFLGPMMWYPGGSEIVRFVLLALAYPSLALVLCGAPMAIAGLLDHWQLVRVLKPVREEEA